MQDILKIIKKNYILDTMLNNAYILENNYSKE